MTEAREKTIALMREILGDEYLALRVLRQTFEEDIVEATSKVQVVVATGPDESDARTIEGRGVGIVDAFYSGLIERYASEYVSLKDMQFIGFTIQAKLDGNDGPGADAVGETTLVVRNSEGRTFEFTASSRSITASALQAALDAVEYFVNSERAFFITRRALQDAQSRSRPDLVQVFSSRLAELVKNTSYTEALAAQDAATEDL